MSNDREWDGTKWEEAMPGREELAEAVQIIEEHLAATEPAESITACQNEQARQIQEAAKAVDRMGRIWAGGC